MSQIAIDGPAGAGKSSIAKLLSKELSFVYVDTGAMYRALSYYCLSNGVSKEDEKAVWDLCKNADVSIKYIDGEQCVLLNGENVNGVIRTPEVGGVASSISVYKDIREKLVDLQRALAEKENVVMDGRDIGSVVLPNAELKIYLDAKVEVRAKRRYDELIEKGQTADLSTLCEEIKERDYRDMHRDNSPLVRVPDAVYIDSSFMTIEEVKNAIIAEYKDV